MTLRELHAELTEFLSCVEEIDPDADIGFMTVGGKHYDINGISVECNGQEIRFYE